MLQYTCEQIKSSFLPGICIIWAALFMGFGCAPDERDDVQGAGQEIGLQEKRNDEDAIFIDSEMAEQFPGFQFQGEYAGEARFAPSGEPIKAGLQIAVYGENIFRGVLYAGGLPGDHINSWENGYDEMAIELHGEYKDHILHLKAEDSPVSVRKIHDHFAVLDSDLNYLGHLKRVRRESSTSGMRSPEDSILLFSGKEEEVSEYWKDISEMSYNLLRQGAATREKYGDMRLHLEAKIGFMPLAPSQERTNSGIYIQNRYEVQIIDSFAMLPDMNSNASLYNEVKPEFNPTFPPLDWQTYDVYFRAPRFSGQGEKSENARVTVYLNGFLIIDDAVLEQGTGAGARLEENPSAEFYLQDHTGPVRFRNIWIVEEEYNPPGVRRLDLDNL